MRFLRKYRRYMFTYLKMDNIIYEYICLQTFIVRCTQLIQRLLKKNNQKLNINQTRTLAKLKK